MAKFRSSERLILVYFLYVALVAAIRIPADLWKASLLAAVMWGSLMVLARTKSIVRDFAPLLFTLIAFRAMNLFTPPAHDFHLERQWIVWDRLLLDDYGLRSTIESAGVLIPFFLELCYALVYGIAPVALWILLKSGKRAHANRMWISYLAGTLTAYALFPYFPSEPPRSVFANADQPNVSSFVREFNLWIVGHFGIHSSVFPSAHVSSALSAGWGLIATIPERRWIGIAMAVYGLCVAVATVYGRYHFAVDALAGIAVSLMGVVALMMDRGKTRAF